MQVIWVTPGLEFFAHSPPYPSTGPSWHLTFPRIARPATPLAPFSVIANLTPGPHPAISDTPPLTILSTARQHDTCPQASRASQYRLNLDKVEKGR